MRGSLIAVAAGWMWVGFAAAAIGQSDRTEWGAAANREYAAVFSRSATPCLETPATAPYVACMNKELEVIGAHLDAFVEDVRRMAGSQVELDALNRMDTAWRAYRESASGLAFRQFQAGSSRGPMSAECEWRLDHAYMEELSGIYMLSQFPNRSPSQ